MCQQILGEQMYSSEPLCSSLVIYHPAVRYLHVNQRPNLYTHDVDGICPEPAEAKLALPYLFTPRGPSGSQQPS